MVASPLLRNRIALVAACLASAMFGLEISSVPVILPTLEQVLHADFKDLQWVMNAYTIACTTVLMATGTLADRFGRKRVFLVSLVAFGITSLICGLAQDVTLLIASRVLQGLSGGAMLICQVAVLSHQFPDKAQRGRAFGVWGIIFGIGLGFGPLVGAAIVALANWQWVFLIHGPIATITLGLAVVSVEESRDPQAKRLDIAGIATLSLAVFCVTFVITQGARAGFTIAGTGIVVAAASFLGFLLAERLSPHPMFDFAVFRIRNFSGALLGSVGMNVSFWPFMIYLPIYFHGVLGYTGLIAGLSLLAYTLPTLVVPPIAERLILRYEARVVIPAGLLTIGLGFFAMRAGSAVDHASWANMLPGCLLAGSGLGLVNTPVTNTTTASVPRTRAGMASGIDMSARLIALAVNIAVMGVVLVETIAADLRLLHPDMAEPGRLRAVAERVASGDIAAPQSLPGWTSPDAAIHGVLAHGFGMVMLYGGVGVCSLAAASFLVFRLPLREKGRVAGLASTCCDETR